MAAIFVVAAVLATASCSALKINTDGSGTAKTGEASPEAFCAVVADHKKRYEAAMDASGSTDEVFNLLSVASAVGDIKSMWSDLAKVAPEDIVDDVKSTSEAWGNSEDAAIDRDAAAAISNALVNGASLARVNQYTTDNCGKEYAMAPSTVDDGTSDGPAAGPALLDTKYTDSVGYVYRLVLNGPAYEEPQIETEHAPPGRAYFGFAFPVTGTIYNQTPDRAAEIPEGLRVAALWPNDSDACEILAGSENVNLDGYCGRAFEVSAASTELSIGSSEPFATSVGPVGMKEIAEDDLLSTQEAFKSPVWIFMAGDSGRTPVCIPSAGFC